MASVANLTAMAVASVLGLYLTVALLKPEWFQ